MSYLPGVLSEIATVAGVEAALAIADAKGGQRVWIPPSIAADHWLTEAVGLDAARKISRHYRILDPSGRPAGCEVTVPLGPTNLMRRARRLLAEQLLSGADPARAAAACGLHVRTAYRMQQRLRSRRNSVQGELF